jgi:hypothetical protein
MIWIEGSVERRGDKVRTRLRICRDGLVIAAYRITKTLGREEILPAEFRDDPWVQAAAFDYVEEIWRHRVRHFR